MVVHLMFDIVLSSYLAVSGLDNPVSIHLAQIVPILPIPLAAILGG